MVEQRRSIRWASHGARRTQVGRKFSWATPADQKKRSGSRTVVSSSWARVASIKNTESGYSGRRDGSGRSLKKPNRSAKEWLPSRSNAINEGLNWPVFASPARLTRTLTSKTCANALRSTVTKNYDHRGDFNAQLGAADESECHNVGKRAMEEPIKRGIWMKQWLVSQKNLWRSIQISKKYPKSKPPSDLRVGKITTWPCCNLQKKQKILYLCQGKWHASLGEWPRISFCAFSMR